jgi:hypothetical protein
MGELFVRGFVDCVVFVGFGGTAGGTVARFIGGEYKTRLRPRIPLAAADCSFCPPLISSAASRDSHGLQMRGRFCCGEVWAGRMEF